MSKIRGGFYCLEDAAREICAEIAAIFATEEGPTHEPILEHTRHQLAVEFLTGKLRDLTEQRA